MRGISLDFLQNQVSSGAATAKANLSCTYLCAGIESPTIPYFLDLNPTITSPTETEQQASRPPPLTVRESGV